MFSCTLSFITQTEPSFQEKTLDFSIVLNNKMIILKDTEHHLLSTVNSFSLKIPALIMAFKTFKCNKIFSPKMEYKCREIQVRVMQ